MGEKYYICDTNVLINNLDVVDKYNVVILSHVLRELDKHKSSQNVELAYSARKAVRFLDSRDNVLFDLKDYKFNLNDEFDGDYVDNKILQACVVNGYGLITQDILLKKKAQGYNVEVVDVDDTNSSFNKRSIYHGWKEIYISEKEFDEIFTDLGNNKFNLLINEYLIVYSSSTSKHLGTLRWNGESLVELKLPTKKKINAKNPLQECAIDMLWNKDIPIKIIAGTFGSGKTLLSVKAGIDFVKTRSDGYSKLMVVRNPIGTGEEIGYLKGSKEDKTADFFKPIIQHLEGGEQEASIMEQYGQLIKEIPYFMKGLSVEDTFILVDEAEDLNRKLIKLLGTRVGTNSCIVFSGDIEQAEEKYIRNNGLVVAIDKLKGNPLVGIVVMTEDVRSKASKVFADL